MCVSVTVAVSVRMCVNVTASVIVSVNTCVRVSRSSLGKEG